MSRQVSDVFFYKTRCDPAVESSLLSPGLGFRTVCGKSTRFPRSSPHGQQSADGATYPLVPEQVRVYAGYLLALVVKVQGTHSKLWLMRRHSTAQVDELRGVRCIYGRPNHIEDRRPCVIESL